MLFTTPTMKLYAIESEGIEEYQVDAINGLVETEFDCECAVDKKALIDTLERVALFQSVYDKGAITLSINNEGITVSSVKSNASETLEHKQPCEFEEFRCSIDAQMLKDQVKSLTDDLVHIQYGLDNAIKITEGTTTLVIALLEEE